MGHACGKSRENPNVLNDVVIDISRIEKGELYKNSELLIAEDLAKIFEASRIKLKSNENNYSAHLNQGICAYFLGYTEVAESHLSKSRQLSKSYESSYLLGLIYLEKNDLKQAQQFFKHSLSEVPMAFVYVRLGEVLLRRNKFEEARKYAKQGLSQFQLEPELVSIIGMSYMPSNLSKASKYCKKSIKLNPELFKPYINLGDIEKSKEQYDEAEQMYKKAMSKATKSQKGFTQLMLSLLYFQTGRLPKAISYFKKSLQSNPNLQEIMISKGFHLLLNNSIFKRALDLIQSENFSECLRTLRPLYKKNKENIPVSFFLATCHLNLANSAKSKHFLKKVIRLSDKSEKNQVNLLLVARSEEILVSEFPDQPETPGPAEPSEKPSESFDQGELEEVEELEGEGQEGQGEGEEVEEIMTQEGNYPNFNENIKEKEVLEENKEVKADPAKLLPRQIKSNSLRQFARSADPEPDKNCSIF